MPIKEYGSYDAVGLAELVRRGQASAEELLNEAVARTDRLDPQLNAVVVKHYDFARKQIERGLPDGPFRGVPFLLKDLNLLAGTRTTFGASLNKDFVADHTDTLTQRYLDAGLVIYGKSSSPEWGLMPTTETRLHGPTRNPWNTEHSSGGSSGGAAAAVAARIVPVAHASDGGGSIRIPASACGVFGLKPTRARTPMGPDRGEGWGGFSIGHVVSISVRDSAAMLDATGYPEPASPFAYPAKERPYLEEIARSPGKLRVAFSSETPSGKPIDPEIRAALERTAETLKKLGHDVREEGLGIDYRLLYRAQGLVSAANFSASIKRWVEVKGHEPGDEIEGLARRAYEAGKKLSAQDAGWGWQQLRLMNRQILQKFETWDVWLTPVLSTNVPRVDYLDTLMDDLKEFDRRQAATFGFTPPFNMTGQPSLSLPLHQSESGLPIAMMFTARYADEATLLRLAGQLEKEMPWKQRKPMLWN